MKSKFFPDIREAPKDVIFGLTTDFNNDNAKIKYNLGVGAYRDNDNKPWVFPVIRLAEREIVNDDTLNKEYLPSEGHQEFRNECAKLLFGRQSNVLKHGRVSFCLFFCPKWNNAIFVKKNKRN